MFETTNQLGCDSFFFSNLVVHFSSPHPLDMVESSCTVLTVASCYPSKPTQTPVENNNQRWAFA